MCGTVWHSMARHGTLPLGMARYGKGRARKGMPRNGTVRYDTVRYGKVRYGTVRYDSVVSGLSEKMNKFLIDQFKFCSIMFVSCVLDPQSFQCGSGSIFPSQPGFRFLDPEPK